MKRISIFILIIGFVLFPKSISAATVEDDGNENSANVCYSTRAANCSNQVFRVGEIGNFMTGPYTHKVFKVNKVDAAGDKIYCNEIGNWIPAYPLIETNTSGATSGDQILRVGEHFIINASLGGDFKGKTSTKPWAWKIRGVDAPTDSVLINIKDKWGNWISTWVYAKPMHEWCDTAVG
ncbi:hypothetical protein MKA40_20470 [[Clostridium] innocuum]|nr:hypothetical protein [[Clostridium] innocuum]